MNIIFDNRTEAEIPEEYYELMRNVIKASVEFEGLSSELEVSVSLVTLLEIKKLNKKYRKTDAVTDVLSFPFCDLEELLQGNSLGDIVICYDRAVEQSEEYGHSLQRELAFLTAHSMLHLMGYDHAETEAEKDMFARQEAILQSVGIGRDY